MTQDVVADGSSVVQSIAGSGKGAVCGIYFDTGKSGIKPGSEAALKEIVKWLQTQPGLELEAVGRADKVAHSTTMSYYPGSAPYL